MSRQHLPPMSAEERARLEQQIATGTESINEALPPKIERPTEQEQQIDTGTKNINKAIEDALKPNEEQMKVEMAAREERIRQMIEETTKVEDEGKPVDKGTSDVSQAIEEARNAEQKG